ncbi:MAG TPA: ATP-binding cassette domain-containing protein, partial [Corynebacterium sp.]|nr:ATP-binding cassette domain-containing protein [Corynebacterium sp.]
MIVTQDLEVRVGARTLLEAPGQQLRVQPGDRIGLIGRNGAGKTTSMRIFAGETEPYGGKVTSSGPVGYLPQDSREGNIEQTARERVLSARGLDEIKRSMAKAQQIMETTDSENKRDKAIAKYSRLEERYQALGGYEADAECAQICDNLGLPVRVLDQKLGTLSGGQRRRVELAQILFAATSGSGKSETTLLLDEPTNHLDADSITWLRGFLSNHEGGLVVISHDVELLDAVCNKIWFLDAVRAEADVYNMGYKKYLAARATDEARRRRERANA